MRSRLFARPEGANSRLFRAVVFGKRPDRVLCADRVRNIPRRVNVRGPLHRLFAAETGPCSGRAARCGIRHESVAHRHPSVRFIEGGGSGDRAWREPHLNCALMNDPAAAFAPFFWAVRFRVDGNISRHTPPPQMPYGLRRGDWRRFTIRLLAFYRVSTGPSLVAPLHCASGTAHIYITTTDARFDGRAAFNAGVSQSPFARNY